MRIDHHYTVHVTWQGNSGTGTSGFRDYRRHALLEGSSPQKILASADKTFHGDSDRWNPEQLLLAALSQCHMLSYLHVATKHRLTVVAYEDDPVGTLRQTPDGGGHFTEATMNPVVTITDAGQRDLAERLHVDAARLCFIRNSVNFPVGHLPVIRVAEGAGLA